METTKKLKLPHFFRNIDMCCEEIETTNYEDTPLKDMIAFLLGGNYLVYFDLENNQKRLQKLVKLKRIYQNFTFVTLDTTEYLSTDLLSEVLSYFYPIITHQPLSFGTPTDWLATLNLEKFNETNQLFHTKYPLNYQNIIPVFLKMLNYKGNIRTGFVFVERGEPKYIIEYTSIHSELLEKIDEAITNKQNYDNYTNEISFSPIGFEIHKNPSADDIEKHIDTLDESTKEHLQIILEKLEQLKASGQLFLVLPILDQILKKQAITDQKELSSVVVTTDYRILLPKYNIEVQFSHLTKVIYILFCQNSYGINLNDLYLYKENIKNLYLEISNQNNYDKMMKTIDDLIDIDSKAIYPHLSRIKAKFYSLMYPEIAENYCIISDPENKNYKYIPWCKEEAKRLDEEIGFMF